jgi:hypothetical protein
MPPSGPSDEIKLQCWEWHTQHYSLRQIAAKLKAERGIDVVHSTVDQWVRQARDMVRYVDHMDVAREYLSAGEALKGWSAELREEMKAQGGTVAEYLPLYLQIHDRMARMLAAPWGGEVDRSGPAMDAKTVELVRIVAHRARTGETNGKRH